MVSSTFYKLAERYSTYHGRDKIERIIKVIAAAATGIERVCLFAMKSSRPFFRLILETFRFRQLSTKAAESLTLCFRCSMFSLHSGTLWCAVKYYLFSRSVQSIYTLDHKPFIASAANLQWRHWGGGGPRPPRMTSSRGGDTRPKINFCVAEFRMNTG